MAEHGVKVVGVNFIHGYLMGGRGPTLGALTTLWDFVSTYTVQTTNIHRAYKQKTNIHIYVHTFKQATEHTYMRTRIHTDGVT